MNAGERICPLCNGLQQVQERCPRCGSAMVDGGILQNYLGPYSPYMEFEAMDFMEQGNQCMHLIYCPTCNYDARMSWNHISV